MRPKSSHGPDGALLVRIQSLELPNSRDAAKEYAGARFVMRLNFQTAEMSTRAVGFKPPQSHRLAVNETFRLPWRAASDRAAPAELSVTLCRLAGAAGGDSVDLGVASWDAGTLRGCRRAELALALRPAGAKPKGGPPAPVVRLVAAGPGEGLSPRSPRPQEEPAAAEEDEAAREEEAERKRMQHEERLRRVREMDAARRRARPATPEEIYARGDAQAQASVAKLLRAYTGLQGEAARVSVLYRRARNELETLCRKSGNAGLLSMVRMLAAAHQRLEAVTVSGSPADAEAEGPTEREALLRACRRAVGLVRSHAAQPPILHADAHMAHCGPARADPALRARALELLAEMEAAALRRHACQAHARAVALRLSETASSLLPLTP
eukprot:tig00000704_g3304.t1